MNRYLMFTLVSTAAAILAFATGLFEDESEKTMRLVDEMLVDDDLRRSEQKRCKRLTELKESSDYRCVAVRLVYSKLLRDNSDSMGDPQPIQELP